MVTSPDETTADPYALIATLRAERDAALAEKAELAKALAGRTSELSERNSEYREQIEQQSAVVDVLKAMSASPDDTQPVFDLITRRARELCHSTAAGIYERDGDLVQVRSVYGNNDPAGLAEFLKAFPMPMTRGLISCRAILDGQTVHIRDTDADPELLPIVRGLGVKAMLSIPLTRDGVAVGAFSLNTQDPAGFTDSQVALLQTFAEQAAIAISSADTYRALQGRTSDLQEALEQQTATADVLKAISRSAFDLDTVLDTLTRSAATLCGAATGLIHIRDDKQFRVGAMFGHSPALIQFRQSTPTGPGRGSASARAALSHAVEQVLDMQADPEIDPGLKATTTNRTALAVPLLRDDKLEGIFVLGRAHVEAFSQRQIELVQTFADQALIAIENARLFNEVQTRTKELTESLEQQTATAEVLKVISRSAFDLQPVLDTLIESAVRLCNATRGGLRLRDGDLFPVRAFAGNHSAEFLDFLRQTPIKAERGTVVGRAALTGLPQNVADVTTDPEYDHSDFLKHGGNRSFLAVPLLRDGQVEGVLSLTRRELQPFTPRQVELVRTFADQAVIAIENGRLFNAVQERTRELTEALERQTATAEVLQVINSSPGNLTPVFDAIATATARLCDAANCGVYRFDGSLIHFTAQYGLTADQLDTLRNAFPQPPGRSSVTARAIMTRRIVHVPDLTADVEFAYPSVVEAGFRGLASVPMLREGVAVGAITVTRQQNRSFSDKQIALLENFATQAVIAIENARLLTETREALEQQTATAEILAVINSSPGELSSVFDAILDKALRLCGAEFGSMLTYNGESFQHVANRGVPAAYASHRRSGGPIVFGRGTTPARLVAGEDVVHTADLMSTEPYERGDPARRALVDLGGARSVLGVALRKDDALLGMISVYRQEVRPFSDKQIALLQNFSAQAVIAMENARLLGELRQRTDEVAELNRGLEARVAEQVQELSRVGRLKRFLAPQLAELIVSQGDEKILESHRREIVVVFCDLRGYTAFTETAEPEEVLDFLRDYHGALGPLVAQFEGTLDQFSGDGIMVFFNDPVPIPDPAERAVRMAMAMREAAGALIVDWRRRDRELGFGAGIAQGYATLGQIGFAERSGYTAIGTVCNLAARLCAEARNGQILIAGRVAAAVEKVIALEDLGSLALKGLTQPVSAFNVPLTATPPALRVIEGGTQSV